MNKRNLILVALVLTSLMVFTQIGAIAANTPDSPGVCVIMPNTPQCAACFDEGFTTRNCFAGGDDCNAVNYWDCCVWAQASCQPGNIFDKTSCGQCCGW